MKFKKTFLMLTPQTLAPNDPLTHHFINTTIFSNILKRYGWEEIDYNTIDINKYKQEGIGFIFNIGLPKYTEQIYEIPVFIKNIFDLQVLRQTTNKFMIYKNIEEYIKKFPKIINSNPMMKTYDLEQLTTLPTSALYLAKPVVGWQGMGIEIIENNQDLINVKQMYQRLKELQCKNKRYQHEYYIYRQGIILNEYIQDILLFKDKKFHLRSYMIIKKYRADKNKIIWGWSIFKKSKILTAAKPYKKGDWKNKEIHDTHAESTDDDYFFPEDLVKYSNIKLSQENQMDIYKQIHDIGNLLFNIIKSKNPKTFEETVNSFEILGIDFMITDKLEVKMLEVNSQLGYKINQPDNPVVMNYNYDFFEWVYNKTIRKQEHLML